MSFAPHLRRVLIFHSVIAMSEEKQCPTSSSETPTEKTVKKYEVTPDIVEAMKTIKRGTDTLLIEEELEQKLARSKATGIPLRCKLGLDPTAPDIHLGHTVVLNKLRQLQDLGHTVIFLIGDFTAAIGDPSGRTDMRKMLTKEDIDHNAECFKRQMERFIDFGEEKNGFLQIDEIHPEYYSGHFEPARGKKFPPIQKVLHIGQEVLVQVVKEPNGSKGAFLTTWISLAGRFLVLTPGQEQIGISRKVSDEEERSRLRELMHGIDPGDDLGVIVRTVSAGVTQATLKNDLVYLKRTWAEVRKKATEVKAPACVYREPGLPERAIRDYLTDDVTEVWVDDADMAERIRNTVALLFPNKKELVRLHNDTRRSMWERFNLRRQLDQIYSREVLMPSGGRLCFDQTEALMAIDINSGKISGKGNFEAMAFKTNMEAAETIARQLKLRDIGGQVVIDFIEMKEHKHVAEVERTLRNAMKYDRARHDVAHMSSFGLLELVRQRTGNSAISISMEPCPACGGTGLRRNLEWQSLQALRDIARALRSRSSSPCQYELPQELGLYLLNHKRDALKELEQRFHKNIEITIKP